MIKIVEGGLLQQSFRYSFKLKLQNMEINHLGSELNKDNRKLENTLRLSR